MPPASTISPIPEHEPRSATSRPRVSLLAIFGVILAAIVCCPFANLLGSVLGMLALQRIALSNGALRGKRLARTAMILGLCFAVGGSLAWWRISTSMEAWLEEAAVSQTGLFMSASQQGSIPAARAVWTAGSHARVSDEAIRGFGHQAQSRYGSFRSFRVTSAVSTSNLLATTYEAAGSFRFEAGERLGSVVFTMEPTTAFSMPVLRLRGVTISDAEYGDLTLPAASTPSTPTTRPTATAPAIGSRPATGV